MQVVQCPHCATQVANDGSLSGRVVSCPRCRKQFQMPPLPVPPSSPFGEIADEEGPRTRTRRSRKPSLGVWLVAGVLVGALSLCILPAAFLWFNASQHDRPPGKVEPAEELPPNPAVEKALSEYELLADEMASLYAKERQLKIIHRKNERSRRASMELASNAGDFERVRQLTDQATKEADELVKLSGEVASASGKWETQNRILDGLLKKELKRIETLPPDQGKPYLDRLERWQDRRQRAFEKGKSNSQ